MTTKRDTIAGGVTKLQVGPPRFYVVDFHAPATLAAVLACPVVLIKAGLSEGDIFGGVERLVSNSGGTVNPVRVVRPNKMFVARRNAPRPLATTANGGAMFGSEAAAFQCSTDALNGLLSRCWCHHIGIAACFRCLRKLGSGLWRLGRVGRAVSRLHSAGIAAIKAVAFGPGHPTLNTREFVHGRYSIPSRI